jgi:hypothetical protein
MCGKGKASIRESVEFFTSYVVSLRGSSTEGHAEPSEKGKEKIWDGIRQEQACKPVREQREV